MLVPFCLAPSFLTMAASDLTIFRPSTMGTAFSPGTSFSRLSESSRPVSEAFRTTWVDTWRGARGDWKEKGR